MTAWLLKPDWTATDEKSTIEPAPALAFFFSTGAVALTWLG